MTDVIKHRGPDREGHWIDKNVGTGHRRLSIFDISPAGHQSIISADHRYALTYIGLHLSQKSFKEQRTTSIKIMISSLFILDFDSKGAKAHANAWSHLKKKGILIDHYDLIIAATCLFHQHSLLTFNIKEFSRVPNLKLASLG